MTENSATQKINQINQKQIKIKNANIPFFPNHIKILKKLSVHMLPPIIKPKDTDREQD